MSVYTSNRQGNKYMQSPWQYRSSNVEGVGQWPKNLNEEKEVSALKRRNEELEKELNRLTQDFQSQTKMLEEVMKYVGVLQQCVLSRYQQRCLQDAVRSGHAPVDVNSSGTEVLSMRDQAIGNQLAGPGFFSATDHPIATTPSGAAQNSGQTRAIVALPAQRNVDRPADALASTSNQAVSAASVSGANLFMMPKGGVSTSLPMPMPAAAKPPNATSLTSMVKQLAPVITKSPNKSMEDADKETDVESTTPETSFTDFKPLVSLPEVITVSGEEDETVMFSERGKLYRFVEKQWKERGLGTIKILHNEGKGTVRVLMHRDQVCANHRIKSDVDIDYKDPNDKKTLAWRALDYTDEEQFCCQFKTPEIAAKFKEVFEKVRDVAKKNVTPKKTDASAMVNATCKLSSPNETQTALPSSQQEEASFGLKPSSTKPVFSFGSMSFGTKPTTPATDMLRSFAAKSTEGKPDEQHKAFGGFTFSAPPVIKNTDATDDKANSKPEGQNKQDEPQKVFGSFMFPAPATFKDANKTESKAVTKGDGQKCEGDGKFKPFAGFTFGFNKEKPGIDLKPSPSQVGSDSVCLKNEVDGRSDHNEEEDGDGTEDEYEPDVDFKAAVTLPSDVKQITGEEDEEKLFGERAKLYVNDQESKQWKERGIGEIKILKNSLKNTFRILMRREQVLKVCANHHITKEMKLLPLDESDKSWCWAAKDFSEDEAREEHFAVLFKSNEIANKFKKVFDKCVCHAVSEGVEEAAPKSAEPLATVFQKKPGEWTCDTCYVQNKPDAKKCVACEILKPGEKADEPEPVTSTTPGITLGKSGGFQFSGLAGKTFSFGSTRFQSAATSSSALSTTTTGNAFSFSGKPYFGTASFGSFGQATQEKASAISSEEMEKKAGEKPSAENSFGEQFKSKPGEWTCEACYVKNKAEASMCVACESSKPKADKSVKVKSTFNVDSGPSFNFTSSCKSVFGQSAKAESVPGGHDGCTSPKPLDLSKEKTKSSQEVSCSESTKPSFGGKGEFTFSMMTPERQDGLQKTPKTPTTPLSAGDEGYYVNQEGEDDHIYFPPVVKLPENVEIRTGEEDEELLYYQRAKLFRFVDNELKERGVGEVRILRHKQTGKTRILMRRDQVLKICMNHALTAELELKPMININTKGRAWVWYAEDFSEDKLVHEQFAIRFKSVELANEFKEAFDKARDDPTSLPVVQHIPDPKHSKSDTRQGTPVKSEKSACTPKSTTSGTFSFKSPDSTTSTPPSVFGQGSNKNTPISTFGQSPTSVFGSSQVFGAANEPTAKDKPDNKLDAGAGAGLLAKLLAEPTKDVLPLTAVSSSSGSSGGGGGGSSGAGEGGADDNDVMIVKVEEIDKERLEEARKWQLPDSFYLFEQRPPCKGCLGCLTDEFDFNTIGSKARVQVPRKTVKSPSRRLATQDKGPAVTKTEADSSSTKEDVVQFGNASLFGDFAALAAKAGNTFAFGKSSDSKSPGWAGAGTTVFSSIQQKSEKQKQNGTSGGDEDGEEVEESPDIHFEPIVQLPEVVDLKTGEEEEEVLYRQRAKLYRFDNDQWKERGIGEMKILKNKNTGRFRLLMRREQVLKVACNHALTADMVLKPLQTSETAWCWYAVDHTENEPRNELFAIRFKNKELAAIFKEKFTECQEILRSQGKACMPSNGNRVKENEDSQNDPGDESDECESNEAEPLFTKRATMYYVDDNDSAQKTPMRRAQPSPERLDIQLQMLSRSNKEIHMEFKKSRKTVQRLEGLIESLESSHRKLDETVSNLGSELKEEDRFLQSMKNRDEKKEEEISKLKKNHEEMKRELHQLKEDFQSQTKALQEALKSVQDVQRSSVTLPQHLQQAQANGMMLPPGGLPAFYGNALRTQRGLMTHQYQTAYGGYPSEYDPYMPRYAAPPSMIPSPYVGSTSQDIHEQTAREAVPEVLHSIATEYDENGYDEEAESAYSKQDQVAQKRHTVKEPTLQPSTMYSPQGPQTAVATSQHTPVEMIGSGSQVYQPYAQAVCNQMPGPGFFSVVDHPVVATPSGAAHNSGQTQATAAPSAQRNLDQSADTLASTSNQAVSAASVSGANLFMMPKSGVSTRLPMPMPAAAKPPNATSLTGMVKQLVPVITKSPNKSMEDADKETNVESTTPETSFTDFKPLVSLPEVITVSGEEDEKVMFSERGKLYRFVEKQWKERGLGTIKILHNEGKGTVRVLMRRDQVLKVCANHHIKSDMDIDYKDPNDKKTLTWRALDYTDEEQRLEQFCCQFKTPEIAAKFKEVFEKARDVAKKNVTPKKTDASAMVNATCKLSSPNETQTALPSRQQEEASFGLTPSSTKPVFSFGSMSFGTKPTTPATDMLRSFAAKSTEGKPDEGHKSFEVFTFSAPPVIKNIDATDDKAKSKPEGQNKQDEPQKVFGSLMFPTPATFKDADKTESKAVTKGDGQASTTYSPQRPQAAVITSQHTPVNRIGSGSQVYQPYAQAVCNQMPGPGFFSVVDHPVVATPSGAAHNSGQTQATAAPSAQINLDQSADTLASTSNQAVSAASVSGANLFMMPKSGVSTRLPMPMPAAAKPPNATSLTGMVKQLVPVITKSPNKSMEDADKETNVESTTPETSFTDFKPLVSLPEVITVSGEEDEKVMFSECGKLYRFVEKQWKERGLGTIQILHNEGKGTVRVLMRRDQVLKVCANHRIKSDMDIDYKDPNDKKTLTWRALDYTDEEQRLEQFCCQFKTPEIAAKFKEVFEKARDVAKKNVTPKKTGASAMVNATCKLSSPNETQTALPSRQQEEASFGLKPSSTKPVFSFGSMSFGTKPTTPATDMLRSFAAKSTEGKPDEQHKAFGGFTFSAPPVIKNIDATDDKAKSKPEGQNKQDEPQKVFGSFMFPAPATFKDANKTESKAVTKGDGQKCEGDGKFKPFAGFTFGFNKEKPGIDLKPSPSQVGSDSVCLKNEVDGRSDHNEEEDGDGTEDEYEPDVDFKAAVTLPSDVKQITGEEDEEKLFGERAKLYVNDQESKQWKERGIGEIKILKNSLKNTFRILMRREQVLKVCANHHITKEMKLLPLDESDKSWCWAAKDFSEDEAREEHFAVLFKSNEIANKFKKVFDKCVCHAVSEGVEEAAPKSAEPLATVFQKKPGEWTCDTCYVQNKPDAKKCVACEILKPGEKADEPEPVTSTTPGITLGKSGGFQFSGLAGKTFSFGSTPFQSAATSSSALSTTTTGNAFSFSGKPYFGTASFGSFGQATQEKASAISSEEMEKKAGEKPSAENSFGEQFKSKPGEWTCEACYVKNKAEASMCVACESSKPKADKSVKVKSTFNVDSGPSFNFTSSCKSVFGQSAKAESVPGGHDGCTSSKPLDLSKEKTKSSQEVSCSESTKPSFGGKGEFTFSMMTPERQDGLQKTPKTPTTPLSAGDEGYYVNQEGEDDHIYFPPVVKLPENVEIRTGEEDEELLYYQRAKLFRFVDNELKERGVGEVRILRHKQTGKTRILMRRDQVLKICMNHALTAELELKPMINTKGRAWVWYAEDFSEDKLVHEQFAIRFKSVELANEFKEAFDKARDDPTSLPVVQHIPDPKHSKSDTRQGTPVKSEKSACTPKSTTSGTFSFKSPDSTTSTPPSVFGQGSNKNTPISTFGQSPTSVFGSSQVFGAANEPTAKDKPDNKLGAGAGAGLLAKLLAEPTKDVLPLTAVSSSSGSSGGGGGGSSGAGEGGADDNDVMIVKVEEIDKERLEEARKWQLPDSFYLFEQRPPCKGCLGCLTDEFDFNTIGSKARVQVPRKTVKSPSRRLATQDKGPAVTKTEADSSSTKEDVVQFGNASLFGDFAALAAKAGNTFAFGKSSDSKSPGWAGAGTTVFSSIQQKSEKQQQNGTSGGDEDGEEVEESPDIHFEPIVQLPEVVDLKTGEEEEEVLYRQRAKLYRFDNDQWKERGIGEMKILKNKNTGRFRLLMRREQVLKVACNHALTADMVLKPLQTSETAWCWYAVDHTENEPRNELFAIRFKNKELAAIFKEKFTECQEILRSQGKACMPSNGNGVKENEDSQNDPGDESDECESNEAEPLFTKRATMYYVDDNDSAQKTPMRRAQPSPERLDIQLQMLSRSNKEIHMEFKKSRKTVQRLEGLIESLESSHRKLDETVSNLGSELKEEDRFLQSMKNRDEKKEEEISKLKKNHEEMKRELHQLKEDFQSQTKALQEALKSVQDVQRSSVTLPQHLQQAQANGMMLPPGGLPAFYGNALRTQRGLMTHQYQTAYGGYPSEYDPYMPRYAAPPSMIPSPYVGSTSQDIHEQTAREAVPEVLHSIATEYDENGYDEEAESAYSKQDQVAQKRHTVKEPTLQPSTMYSPQGPQTAVATSQHTPVEMIGSGSQVYQPYAQAVCNQMPGPGFFSVVDHPVVATPSGAAHNSGQTQATAAPSTQRNLDQSADTLASTLNQAVSAASVSGANLFMMPKSGVSTSLPMPMPAAAKPPNATSLTSMVKQLVPVITKSPNKSMEDADKETNVESTTPETSFTDFKPLVSLPEVITVSGEEDEKVMFSERGKLYRFVEKQWKERGLGTIKILHNEGKGTVRVLMRRDQVLKVCANHHIKSDMDIDYKDPNDKKTLTWRALDYTDEEQRLEQFCCQFKTPEIAAKFKEVFEKARDVAKKNVTPKKTDASAMVNATCKLSSPNETQTALPSRQQEEASFGLTPSSTKPVFSFGSMSFGTKPTTPATDMLRSFAAKSTEGKPDEGHKSFEVFTFSAPPVIKNIDATDDKAKSKPEGQNKQDEPQKVFGSLMFPTPATFKDADKTESKAVTKGDGQASTTYSPQRPQAAVITSQHTPVNRIGSGSQVYQPYAQAVCNQMPGPGFFSVVDHPVVATPSGAAHNSGQTQATAAPSAQRNLDQSADTLASTSNQAVSAASVSGANLFMMPKSGVSTRLPMPMPAAAKPPNATSLTGMVKQLVPVITKSPNKSMEDADKETNVESTTPETSFTDFKPLVSLPEVITVSGEEDETVMFSECGKLYRFVEKQWKERGLGTIQILHNEGKGTVRVLMRRDQVLKVCANHRIKSDMDIDYKDPNDKKTLTWRALDYTDEEQRLEQFCCQFKTPEIAAKFKEVFEKARDVAKKNVTPKKTGASAMVNATCKLSSPNETQTALPSRQQEEASFGLKPSSTKPVFSFGSMSFGTKPTTPATDMLRSFAAKSTEGKPDEQHKAFGGFTFSAPPVIKNTDATDDKANSKPEGQNKQDEPQKVFGSFMFPAPATFKDANKTESKAVTKGDGQKCEGDGKFKPFAGFTFGFNKEKPGIDLKPSPSQVGSDSVCLKNEVDGRSDHNEEEDGDGTEDEYEPDVDFKAAVTLPSDVKQITGEEDEEKLFGERAKLYVNDQESKQWKERILMRREQVLKVCANHHITKEMKLLPLDESDKSWCWAAKDFSEDEAREEHFAVLFKSNEIANKFKKVFDKCVCHAVSEGVEEAAPKSAEPLATVFQKKPGEWTCDTCYVQNKPDAKKCVACEILKPGEKADEPEPVTSTTPGITLGKSGGFQFSGLAGKTFSFGSTPFQSAATSSSALSTTTTGNAFSFSGKPYFGTASFGSFGQATQEKASAIGSEEMEKKAGEKPSAENSFGEQFKSKPGEWTCEACYVKNKAEANMCVACESSKPKADKSVTVKSTFNVDSGPSFNFTSSCKSVFGQSAKAESVPGGHDGCTSSKPLDLSKEKTKSSQEVSCSESTKPSFGGKCEFTFSMMTPERQDGLQKTPKTPTTPLSAGDEGYYVNQEGEDDHIYFPPVVKLPENVEIRTGEEDEELLYYQRAKLFRFVDNEWKERGVGEVRILRHKQTGKTRILMRRDQVLNICMNHALTAELELKPMINTKGRAWVWYAEDFSEDKLVHEQFAIRFKSVELANEFKEAFDKARDDPTSLPVVQHIPDPKHSKSDTRQGTPVKSEKSACTPKSTTSGTFSFKSPDSTTSTPPSVFGQGSNKNTPISTFGQSPTSVFGSSQVFGAANEPTAKDKPDNKLGAGAGAGLLAKLLAEPTKDVLPLTAVSSSSGSSGGGGGGSSGAGEGGADDNDVMIVKVEEIDKERLEEARKWQLPDSFYLFEQRPPCKGCLGCLTDEFDFNTIGSKARVQVPRKTVKSPSRRLATQDKGPAVTKTEADSSSTKEDVVQFGNASLFGDFAALAAKAGNTFAFGKSSDSKSPGWAGAGTTVFSSIQQKSEKQKQNGTSGGDEDGEEVEESPDIHFEPIVQLPEVVDLKTGEEEEEVLYRQRAKLYRFDNDQWKERGIGEMKILKNKNTGRFRLLMRREQVLKVACNHALTADMVLKPLQTSETAWCWYAVDHTENEPRNELFAIRFKNKELAAIFKEKFTECQEILRSQGKACMPTNGNRVKENEDSQNDPGDESDECESNEAEPLFTKRATMYYVDDNDSAQQVAMGDVMVLHDEDIDGARIRMKSDKNEVICNHVICRNYQLQCDLKEKSCHWIALDFSTDEPKRRHFKVQFSSSSAAEEFQQAFDKGLDMARSVGIDEMKEGVLLTGELMQPPIAGYETSD